MTTAKYRPLTFGVTRAVLRDGAMGTHYLQADQALPPYPERLTDRLVHWARERPDQTLFARRAKHTDGSSGDWQHVSFGHALDAARRIGQGLLDRGLSAERPVLILSENDLEHALLALGCLYAGIPWCPTSPAYSLISQDHDKLKHVVRTLTPGLVFASDAQRYGRAMLATLGDDVEMVATHGTVPGRATTSFAALAATAATPAVDAAMAATGPDTIVKFLFTSGSTKLPKAVINTQRQCWPRATWCWSTGCRGTTRSAATTTSAWWSTTAARCTSTTASPRRR
jgi:feruloyl-CoA synthase